MGRKAGTWASFWAAELNPISQGLQETFQHARLKRAFQLRDVCSAVSGQELAKTGAEQFGGAGSPPDFAHIWYVARGKSLP